MYVKTLPSGEKVRMYTECFVCININGSIDIVKLYKAAHDKAVDEEGRVWDYVREAVWRRSSCSV